MTLITNEDTSVLPYNDDEMVYDLDRNMYVLTNNGVLRLVGENLITLAGSELKAELIRYEVSQDIMNFISKYSLFTAFKYKVWLLATQNGYRELFKRVLADQMRYYIRSGAGVLKDMHGVNISSNKFMDISNMRNDILVSSSVYDLLSRMGLLYTGKLYYTEYEEDGTW